MNGNPSSAVHFYTGTGSFTITATATDEDGTWNAVGSTVTISVTDPGHILTWTGAENTLWSKPHNWIDENGHDALPTPAGTVQFVAAYNLASDVDGAFVPASVDTMLITAGYTQTITLQKDLTVSHTTQDDGDISGTSMFLVASGGDYQWTAGSMSGSGETRIRGGATLTISGGADKYLTDRTLQNDGTATWSGGDVAFSGATFKNSAAATVTVSGTGDFLDAGGSNFTNDGTLTKTSATDTTFQMAFNNSGQLNVQAGGILLEGGGDIGGQAAANTATRLELIDGSFVMLPGFFFSGSGFLIVGALSGGSAPVVFVNGTVTVSNWDLRDGQLLGAGDLELTQQFLWSDGAMMGTGTTRIKAGATATVSGVLVRQRRPMEIEYGATLNESADSWSLATTTLTNRGRFNVISSGTLFNVIGSSGTFINGPEGELNVSISDTFNVFISTFTNEGVVSVAEGALVYGTSSLTNTGFLNVAAGSTVTFSSGTVTFDPDINDTSNYMMRGDGWYLENGTARVEIRGVVTADNFHLLPGAVLGGAGIFQPHRMIWSGGTMDDGGVTLLDSGEQLFIDGDVMARQREIRAKGSIEWQPGADSIELRNGATIVVDGGRFDVTAVSGELANPDNSAGSLRLINLGVFERMLAETPGTVAVRIPIENNGGIFRAVGDMQFSGPYTQTLAASVGDFGAGYYTWTATATSVFDVTGGTVRLNGGTLYLPNTAGPHLSNAAFVGAGAFEHGPFVTSNAHFDLTGNLRVAKLHFTNNTVTSLHGYTLNCSIQYSTNESGSIIQPQGGRVEGYMRNYAIIRMSGTFGGTLENWGRIEGDPSVRGQFTIEGDLVQYAGATLSFGMSGATPGGFDQLVVLGHAVLAGAIDVSLYEGFVPDPDTPDEFSVLTFGSYEGAFDVPSVELGAGHSLVILYNESDVTLWASKT